MQVASWVVMFSMPKLILNACAEIVPNGHESFEVRTSIFGTQIEATRYQVGLLQQFEKAADVQDCLASLPFELEASETFLNMCQRKGILLELGADESPLFPKRISCSPRFANTPAFDAQDPPAFVFLGVPYDGLTTGSAGARFGPSSIRASSEGARYRLDPHRFEPLGFYDYASQRRLLKDITLADAGDVFYSPGEPTVSLFERVSAVVAELCEAGSIPLIMGGDHSITWPVMRSLPHSEFGIIHFDAHTDLGEALLPGQLHHGSVFTHIMEKLEYVSPLVQLGLRGIIDASEHVESDLVTQFGMDQIRKISVDEILEKIPADRPYYMSIDIDVVDPAFAPSTGTPVPNGMLPSELKSLVHAVARQRELIAVDVVEVAMCANASDPTAGLAMELLLTAADGLVKGLSQAPAEPELSP
jgi:agmatinase